MAEEQRKDEQGVRQDHRLPHKAWVSLTTAVGRPLAVVLAIIAIVFILLLVVGLIWGLTWYLIPIFGSKKGLDVTQRKDLVQGFASVVQALAVVLTGTVGLIGLLFTWRNLRQTRESTQRTLELTEQGQITERFTRAIDQLGDTDANEKPRLEIRLGGIYALERIDKESRERAYHPTVMEVLTAYVRENSRRDNEKPLTPTSVSNEDAEHDKGVEQDEEPPVRRPPTDIQAILDVLRRREEDYVPQQQRVPLDLRGAILRGAILRGANLLKADLRRASLQQVDLQEANLQLAKLYRAVLLQADLQGAYLQGANLQEANLARAFFEGANLRGAFLQAANLTGANLARADLQAANLQAANLPEASLYDADLARANLARANLARANLEVANLTGANLARANFQEAILERANLARANLRGANLARAILTGANLQEAILERADFEVAILQDANLARANLREAKVTNEQLADTLSLQGATMPNGQKYEDWLESKGKREK